VSQLYIADTGLFVAMRQSSNSRYQAVRDLPAETMLPSFCRTGEREAGVGDQ
jgi:hypothetical protein